MQTFQNIALPDTYGPTGDFYSNKGVACFVSIFNNPAAFEILQRDPGRTSELVRAPEQASAPGSFLVEGAAGMSMRNNIAGSVSRVFVTIFEPTDPRIAGFNPITATISASGAVTPTGSAVTDLAYQQFTTQPTLIATTEGTADVLVTAPAFNADGISSCVVEYFVPGMGDFSTNVVVLVLYLDGVSIGKLGEYQGSGNLIRPVHLARKLTPAAGSRTFSIRGYNATAANQPAFQVGAGGVGNFMPGFIRVFAA